MTTEKELAQMAVGEDQAGQAYTHSFTPDSEDIRAGLEAEKEAALRAYNAALEAGERAHLLTIGSPARGLAWRVTLGSLSGDGRWHRWWLDSFFLWNGIRYDMDEARSRTAEELWRKAANRLPRKLVYHAVIRAGVHATTGKHGDQVVPDLTFFEALERWDPTR